MNGYTGEGKTVTYMAKNQYSYKIPCCSCIVAIVQQYQTMLSLHVFEVHHVHVVSSLWNVDPDKDNTPQMPSQWNQF